MKSAAARLFLKKAIDAGVGLSQPERVMKAVPEMGYLLGEPVAVKALGPEDLDLVQYVHSLGAEGALALHPTVAKDVMDQLKDLRRQL